jgi:hypothetical protein
MYKLENSLNNIYISLFFLLFNVFDKRAPQTSERSTILYS